LYEDHIYSGGRSFYGLSEFEFEFEYESPLGYKTNRIRIEQPPSFGRLVALQVAFVLAVGHAKLRRMLVMRRHGDSCLGVGLYFAVKGLKFLSLFR